MGPAASGHDVRAQLHSLEHRGPDAIGIFSSGPAAIGQTRLAVIDLLTGDPPVTSADGSVGAVLNGEIYNFQALRQALLRTSHRLSTRGDTEVIAHLAEDLEPVQLAQQLNGMFAFAVWDSLKYRLVLGRDRLGKKPLYYWFHNGQFVFASEIKALLAHPLVPVGLTRAQFPPTSRLVTCRPHTPSTKGY